MRCINYSSYRICNYMFFSFVTTFTSSIHVLWNEHRDVCVCVCVWSHVWQCWSIGINVVFDDPSMTGVYCVVLRCIQVTNTIPAGNKALYTSDRLGYCQVVVALMTTESSEFHIGVIMVLFICKIINNPSWFIFRLVYWVVTDHRCCGFRNPSMSWIRNRVLSVMNQWPLYHRASIQFIRTWVVIIYN